MSDTRNWLKTLWPASYNGMPFWFEKETATGGRDVVIHQFAHRDQPFIEDMGEVAHHYEGDAYIHGDDADTKSAAFEAILNSRGPGVLVVPIFGPVPVHCQSFHRRFDKDKLGFISFAVKFVRDGAATGLISIPLAGKLAYLAADDLAAQLVTQFAATVKTLTQPDFVVDAATSTVAQVLAVIDETRGRFPLDAKLSAQLRDIVLHALTATDTLLTRLAPDASTVAGFADQVRAVVPDASADPVTLMAQTVVGATRLLGSSIVKDLAPAAMIEFADAFPPLVFSNAVTAAQRQAETNTQAVTQCARLAALAAWSEALIARSYDTRQQGVAMRALVADRFEAELNNAPGALSAALYVALENLRGRVVDFLSRLIADLKPVIVIGTARSLPSLFMAWRLYADPARASEIVARNQVPHPSFLPTDLAVLSSGV